MPTIVHFEMPSDNVERSKSFYSDLFGWNFEKVPTKNLPEGEEYWSITTKDHEGNNAINGGMMKRMNPEQQGILNSIGVSSVDEYSAKVEQLGGVRLRCQKWQFQIWGILLCVLTQKIIPLDYLRMIPQLNELSD